MRSVCLVVLVAAMALVPSLALASGQLGIGGGPDHGWGGFCYEFKGKTLTPQVAVGIGGAGVGANYYFSDKMKKDMPAGWRAQLFADPLWVGGWSVSLSGGQRTGNWTWGLGVSWVSIDTSLLGWDVDEEAIVPHWSWGFRW
jgi:hypothetical protein